MALHTYKVKIQEGTPFIMHNCESANPMNKFVKQMAPIKSKRTAKSDAEQIELQRLSFLSSLYWSDSLGGIYLPVDNLSKMLLEAGRALDKMQAKKQFCGISFDSYLGYQFQTKNRDNIKKLQEDEGLRYNRMVVIGKARVFSTRAVFNEWSVEFEITLDDHIVDVDTVEKWFEYAGTRIGLGCRRPNAPTPGKNGCFKVTKWEKVEN